MAGHSLETDYLVVGCGAAGMAFTDALIAASERATSMMVDRRHAPGGHWNEALSVRAPASAVGVLRRELAAARQRDDRPPWTERRASTSARAPPRSARYYDRVMQQRLLPSGRVRYFPMCELRRRGTASSRACRARRFEVKVRKKLVDATYLEPSCRQLARRRSRSRRGARCVPVERAAARGAAGRGLRHHRRRQDRDRRLPVAARDGVSPADIRWIKPREAWLVNREFVQGGELVGTLLEGIALQLEAAAQATSLDDLFARLEAGGAAPARRRARRRRRCTTAPP